LRVHSFLAYEHENTTAPSWCPGSGYTIIQSLNEIVSSGKTALRLRLPIVTAFSPTSPEIVDGVDGNSIEKSYNIT